MLGQHVAELLQHRAAGRAAEIARTHRGWVWLACTGAAAMALPVTWCMFIWGIPDSPQAYQPFVPFAVAYLIWTRRQGLMELARRTAGQPRGSISLALSGCLLLVAAYPPEIPGLSVVAFTLIVAGSVYYLYGLPMLRALRGPIAFLLAAAPLQAAVTDAATRTLQLMSTSAASAALQLIRVPVSADGNMLIINDYRLAVTPACSGLALLLPVIMLTVWLLMLMETSLLQKLLLTTYSILTALVLNVIRITAMGLLAYYDHDVALMLHDTNSWIFTIVAFAAMMLWTRLLRINKVCNLTYDLRGFSLPPPP